MVILGQFLVFLLKNCVRAMHSLGGAPDVLHTQLATGTNVEWIRQIENKIFILHLSPSGRCPNLPLAVSLTTLPNASLILTIFYNHENHMHCNAQPLFAQVSFAPQTHRGPKSASLSVWDARPHGTQHTTQQPQQSPLLTKHYRSPAAGPTTTAFVMQREPDMTDAAWKERRTACRGHGMCVRHAAATLGAIGALAAPRLSWHAAVSPATIRNSTPSRSRVRTAD